MKKKNFGKIFRARGRERRRTRRMKEGETDTKLKQEVKRDTYHRGGRQSQVRGLCVLESFVSLAEFWARWCKNNVCARHEMQSCLKPPAKGHKIFLWLISSFVRLF